MERWRFDSPGPEASREIAAELGRSIGEPGLVLALIGPLGAGKTVFVKGLAEGLGIDARQVSSPTFVIANEYPLPRGPRVLHHLDFYRLETERELDSIGFEDMFARGSVLAVEWADRFRDALGSERLEIELEGPSRVESVGGAAEESADEWLDESPLETSPGESESPPLGGRVARVRAFGPEAERVLADWAARVSGLLERRARAGRRSRGSERFLAVLLLALGVAGLSRLEIARTDEPCRSPRAVDMDRLGVREVACGMEGEGLPEEAGVGGLLFGRAIDLNTASADVLETLPAIGPARARAIVESRTESAFESVVDLERVAGIGPQIRARLAPWVRVGPAGASRARDAGRTGALGEAEHAAPDRTGAPHHG